MADVRLLFGFFALLWACVPTSAQTIDGFNPGADGTVYALALQPDGRILVGGSFEALGGGAQKFIGRLNTDGSRDASFRPTVEGPVFVIARQPDGKILIGGSSLLRVNADGSIDASFKAVSNIQVLAIAVQANGKILVGGLFGSIRETERQNLARLNADGSVDATFNSGANAAVFAVALQPDGKVLVGGRQGLRRLHPDGSPETAFDPQVSLVEPNAGVYVIIVQADGRVLVGGRFAGFAHTQRENIGRINADGTVDGRFNPGTIELVSTLAVQPDGKILLGGAFTRLGGGGVGTMIRNCIGRINADGSLDVSFNPGANGPVNALAVQPDGKILVGGDFTGLGGGTGMTPRRGIGRIVPSP